MEDPFSPQEESILLDTSVRTRCGYAVADMLQSFNVCLLQAGAVAAGKCLHYSADLICSGCFELWQKVLWEFAFDHIGIASPRIFLFLQKRFQELTNIYSKIPTEVFYKSTDCQHKIAECVLVVRACPRKPPLKMPRIPPQTHSDEWVQQSIGSSSVAMPTALAKVFKSGADMFIVRRVATEFIRAIEQGATEKCFFWLKWLLEEEAFLKKETRGSLSTLERGPPELAPKARVHISFFFEELLTELYKDFQLKGLVRMNEEFSGLLRIFRTPNKQITQRRRTDCLCLCIQILCEVPKWKVAGAPTLVADPVGLQRAVSHVDHFFQEVLVYAPPTTDISKEAKKSAKAAGGRSGGRKTAKEKEQEKANQQMADYDAMIKKILNI